MAETAANRLPFGYKVYLADQGSGTAIGTPALPALTGTAITWGTSWPQLPSISSEPEIKANFEFEPFEVSQYLHKIGMDLVGAGIDEISFEIKETDMDAWRLGLGTAIFGSVVAGTGTAALDSLTQPIESGHFPLKQIALQRTGPQGGWGQVIHFPRVQRIGLEFMKTPRRKIGTLKLSFAVFATENATVIPEGTCYKMYEYKSAPL